MAAMPYGPPTTLADFISKATDEYGATLEALDLEVEGDFGLMKQRYMEREVDGGTLHVMLPLEPDDVLQTPYVIDGLCRRLGISTKDAFGYELDQESGQITYCTVN